VLVLESESHVKLPTQVAWQIYKDEFLNLGFPTVVLFIFFIA
jgi:hypothetical protein